MIPDWDLRLGDWRDPGGLLDWSPQEEFRGRVHLLADPPYSAHVHANVARNVEGFAQGRAESEGAAPKADLGFAHLDPKDLEEAARAMARAATGWILVFSDVESCHLWREGLQAAGARYVRTGGWRRHSGPQRTGDRPAQALEVITIAHHAQNRLRWNAGGGPAWWEVPVVPGRERIHPTQKPLLLLEALVREFTSPGDLIVDPYAGSGATGEAALRLGRRFLGWERDPAHHRKATARLSAIRGIQADLFQGPPPRRRKARQTALEFATTTAHEPTTAQE